MEGSRASRRGVEGRVAGGEVVAGDPWRASQCGDREGGSRSVRGRGRSGKRHGQKKGTGGRIPRRPSKLHVRGSPSSHSDIRGSRSNPQQMIRRPHALSSWSHTRRGQCRSSYDIHGSMQLAALPAYPHPRPSGRQCNRRRSIPGCRRTSQCSSRTDHSRAPYPPRGGRKKIRTARRTHRSHGPHSTRDTRMSASCSCTSHALGSDPDTGREPCGFDRAVRRVQRVCSSSPPRAP